MRVGSNISYGGRTYNPNKPKDVAQLLWAMYFNGLDISTKSLTTKHNSFNAPILTKHELRSAHCKLLDTTFPTSINNGHIADILFSRTIPNKGKNRERTRGYFLWTGDTSNRIKGFSTEYLVLLPLLAINRLNPSLQIATADEHLFEQSSLGLRGLLPSQPITNVFGREQTSLLNYSVDSPRYADVRIDFESGSSLAGEVKNYNTPPSRSALLKIIDKYKIQADNGGEMGREWRFDSKPITNRALFLATPPHLETRIVKEFNQLAIENDDGIPWTVISLNQVNWRQLYESTLDVLLSKQPDLLYQSQMPLIHGEKESPTDFMMRIYDLVIKNGHILSRNPHTSAAAFMYLSLKYLFQEVNEPTMEKSSGIVLNGKQFSDPPHIISGKPGENYSIEATNIPLGAVFLDFETAGIQNALEENGEKIAEGILHSGSFICVAGLGYRKKSEFVIDQRIVHNPYLEQQALEWLVNEIQSKTVYTHGSFDVTMLRERMTAHMLPFSSLLRNVRFIDLYAKTRVGLQAFERAYLPEIHAWRSEDINSEDIPGLFWNYMRGSNAKGLEQILAHNYTDVASTAVEYLVLQQASPDEIKEKIALSKRNTVTWGVQDDVPF